MAAPLSHALAYLYATNRSRPAPQMGAGRGRRQVTRRAFRRAAARAAAVVVRRHPRWADALFDEHFLTRHAEPLLFDGYRRGLLPGPAALARAWAAQFGPVGLERRQRRAAGLLPAANDFLARLAAEVAGAE